MSLGPTIHSKNARSRRKRGLVPARMVAPGFIVLHRIDLVLNHEDILAIGPFAIFRPTASCILDDITIVFEVPSLISAM